MARNAIHQIIGTQVFKWWGSTGRAPGYLYQVLDSWGQDLVRQDRPLRAKVTQNLLMDCDLSDHVQRQLYFFGVYEPIDSFLFSQIVQPGMTVMDGGANVGFYSLLAAAFLGDSGEVHSFEAVPKTVSLLEHHVQLNGFERRIVVNPVALWNKRETLNFQLDASMVGNVGSFTAGKVAEGSMSVSAQAIPLDQYVQDKRIERIDFVKLDIEGAELFALKGGFESIKKHKPIIQIEIFREACKRFDYEADEIWDLLAPLDYQIYQPLQSGSESKMLNDFSGLKQSNLFLYPKGSRPKVFDTDWSLRGIRSSIRRSLRAS